MEEQLTVFAARAPSNIALIKYMGKKPEGANLPENPSLSMTLDGLCSFAEISIVPGGKSGDAWISELPRLSSPLARVEGLRLPRLDDAGSGKVLRHLKTVREACPGLFREHGLEPRGGAACFALRTANTFPEASGIASSASSFAAITLAVALACAADPVRFETAYDQNPRLRRALARLSRMGSGSSCRSFEGPWVQWNAEETQTVPSPLADLSHFVLVVSEGIKHVSSSQAHSRVKTSPLWAGRVERATARLGTLRSALESGDFSQVARVAWSESWEMHSLFHTSREPFSYWEPGTVEVLRFFAPLFEPGQGNEPPPIVTLDAGPNVHVIVESRLVGRWRTRLRERFPALKILEDRPGKGARCWVEGTR